MTIKFKHPSIKYTSRDFNSIRNDLIQYAKKYYPDSFQDFNEASFGAMMVDAVSYIGDIMSFYLDYQANESFLTTANEYNNILKHGKALGFKIDSIPSSYGVVTLFVSVPVSSTGLGPQTAYIPILRKGSMFGTTGGTSFMLIDDVNFADPSNDITPSKMIDGRPTEYAIKAYGEVVSGRYGVKTYPVGEFERFKRIDLGVSNLTEVISVIDSDGNEWLEVEHLSQNIIYRPVVNNGANSNIVSNLLKPFVTMRRFTIEREQGKNFIQFGYGSENNLSNEGFLKPDDIVLERHARDYITDLTFDPTKLIQSDKFGVSPSNTTLTVAYRTNDATTVNAAQRSIRKVKTPLFKFPESSRLTNLLKTSVASSLEVTNEASIVGDVTYPSPDEIKRRIFDVFTSQNRAVTEQDYKALIYMMPGKFGSIKRCHIFQDPDAFKRNINVYVISEDSNGNLERTNDTIKNNLKNWLNQYRMLNDTIDILNAKRISIGIKFTIVAQAAEDRFAVLRKTENALRESFISIGDIAESINIAEIYRLLNNVGGVSDTVDVTLERKAGEMYSNFDFNIEDATSFDGRYLICPEEAVFEIRYLDVDIKGAVR
jgi:hypothetical protein